MRFSRVTLVFLSLVIAAACRDNRRPDAPRSGVALQGAPKPRSAVANPDPWADTGRVIDRGVSSYAVIADTACPGTRIVSTKFATAQDLIVRITESDEQRQCVEGSRSDFTAAVHTADGKLVTSIHGSSSSVGVVEVRDAVAEPLLSGNEYGGGSGPLDETQYWNLRTGKPVFHSEGPLQSFVANGKVRYLAASGGNGDTLGIVEYGDGRREAQRVVFTRGLPAGTKSGANFQVEQDTLVGPMSGGRIVIGGERDSVAIRGITLRVRVNDVYLEEGITEFELATTIVDDRLVALPVKKLGQP